MEYGGDLLRQFLLNELVAEGHLEKRGTDYFYSSERQDYKIGLTITARDKTIRLSED